MTMKDKEYEFARKIIKREQKEPNPWSENRKKAMITRVAKDFGDKGVKEFAREFKKELGLR